MLSTPTPTAQIKIIPSMSADQARAAARRIREGLEKRQHHIEMVEVTTESVRREIQAFYEAEAWTLLGYSSFKQAAEAEFGRSWQQAYKLLKAAAIDDNLTELSPAGESYMIPVNHANQLAKLKSPDAQYRAYKLAMAQADLEGRSDGPTEGMVRKTVEAVKAEEEVMSSAYPVLKHMVATEAITATTGRAIQREMDKLDDPMAQAFVQKLMTEHDLKNPDLIYPLGHKWQSQDKSGKPSKVLAELERTGHLGGVPLAEATTKHLHRANQEARQEHITEGLEQKRLKSDQPVPEAVATTLWKNDPERTVKALLRDLPQDDLEAAFNLLAAHLGYVRTQATVSAPEGRPQTGDLLQFWTFPRNGLVCAGEDAIALWMRKEVVGDEAKV